ncbi:Auxin response factor 18, partial [Cucurbita argyrosperma subsp. sororia]
MITFMDSKEKSKEMEKCLDPQLWHACAGGMVQMPPVNARVFYFPQGHAEHACASPVDFRTCPRLPSYTLCRVSAIKFLADPDTDEVFAKLRLIPINGSELDFDDGIGRLTGSEQDKPTSFAKTLTQSDANNGGGFSVPRYCAETIFPPLDYSADPPVQTILAKDVHGETWKFRHIYRGTPRRHLLTTGWSSFVNHKKLVAGDSIVFLRAENGDLCVGIRRAKRGAGDGPDLSCGWNGAVPYGAFSADESLMGKGKVKAESVIEAATLAANGQPFEIVFYPRASTPEFCVKAALVKAALQIRWCSGMRFKMAFETEDSSRISWFMGTVNSAQVADPLRWPESPWRLLLVTWDEPDLLQNVKRVSPWLVESVSNMSPIHIAPFSSPRKKLRHPQHPDFPLDNQPPMPLFSSYLHGSGSPFGCPPDNNSAGMQGARHAHFGLSLSDFHLSKLHSGLFPIGYRSPDPAAESATLSCNAMTEKPSMSENVSCLLTMAHSTQASKKCDGVKTPQLILFGRPILTELHMSQTYSGDTVSSVGTGNSSPDGNGDRTEKHADGSGSSLHQQRPLEGSSCENFQCYKDDRQEVEPNVDPGHCKVFMESEDVGRTLDLSSLGSYEELYTKLGNMFEIDNSETLNHVLYRDVSGAVKHVGDEQFSDFIKTARRLTIL